MKSTGKAEGVRERARKWLESLRAFKKDGSATGKLKGFSGYYCCDECGSSQAPGELEKLLTAFAESESSLARKKEREACAKLACHFCAYPGEWSTAEKMDNGWMHLYGERRASVVACAAAAIHERNREEQP